jgi:hypothetical protein
MVENKKPRRGWRGHERRKSLRGFGQGDFPDERDILEEKGADNGAVAGLIPSCADHVIGSRGWVLTKSNALNVLAGVKSGVEGLTFKCGEVDV